MDLFFLLLLLILAAVGIVALDVWNGMRKLGALGDVLPNESGSQPEVSIIIPALNEAETIQAALTSVLALDYENLQIIVVNDRSTDRTGEILADMQGQDPRLQVIHIKALPSGWLGKTHALMQGSKQATGDYLLFTDADVVFEKSTLKRAMHHVLNHRLDHLSMLFEVRVKNGLLAAMMMEFGGALLFRFKPWKARNPKSKRYMGVGAFNLVSTQAYHQIGTHKVIAMAPIDDIMLGKCIKEGGLRQDCLAGYGYVAVEWYRSVPAMIKGLQKNIFAAYQFNLAMVSAATVMLALTGLLPQIAIGFTSGPSRLVCALLVLLRLLSFADAARKYRLPMQAALWSLISPIPALYAIWRATLSTLFNQGITWRNTFYPLAELKKYKF